MNLSTESDNKAAEDSPQLKVTKTMCEVREMCIE